MSGPILIWGCGGHGREVNHVCEAAGIEVAGFLDERSHMRGTMVDDIPVFGDLVDVPAEFRHLPVFPGGVGDPALKRRFMEKTLGGGCKLAPPIIHPGVRVSKRNRIGEGAFLAEGCILTVQVEVGPHATINRAVNLSHDVQVGAFATLSPGVLISGDVSIGEGAFIGTGAAVREKLQIGAWSRVGGGAFVAADVPERTLVLGVPATQKRRS